MPYDHIRILNTLFVPPIHHHINYTINHTTITNSFNTPETEPEPDYLSRMRQELIAEGKYRI